MGIGSELENWDSREDRYGSHIPPIYLSVVYDYVDYEAGLAVFSDRGTYVRYSREENPTVRLLERVLAKIEGGGRRASLQQRYVGGAHTLHAPTEARI